MSRKQLVTLTNMCMIEDQDENVVWTIETEKSPAAEITANTEIGIYEDRYYYAHCGVIYAVRLRDGKEIWHSASSHGSMTGTDFGPDGTLYYCSFYGPDFGAIDKDGNELYEVEQKQHLKANELYDVKPSPLSILTGNRHVAGSRK